jgi:hypothetical protein
MKLDSYIHVVDSAWVNAKQETGQENVEGRVGMKLINAFINLHFTVMKMNLNMILRNCFF